MLSAWQTDYYKKKKKGSFTDFSVDKGKYNMKKRYLVLQDKTVFEGYAFGADCEKVGELIFSTNVVGYIELLTDPCYYGQIVAQTFPMIGNYGIIEEDFIGKPALSGYVVREWCSAPSNFRCEYDIDKFLKENGIPGIYGVDTRELTNIIRDGGIKNAMICDEIPADFSALESYKIVDAVKNTVSAEKAEYIPEGEAKANLAIINFGSTKKMELALKDKGYKVTVLPYDVKAEDVLALGADAVILSEGAGNPEEMNDAAAEINKLMGKVPMFGIGLGHQIMAIAKGAEIEKLPYGHHGGNQPAKIVGTARTLITSQNHNYAVKESSIKEGTVSHFNGNDKSVEGIAYEKSYALSVQFEVSADYVIEKLEKVMEEFNNAAE